MREDDTEEAVRKRLKDFREKTEPALELFRRKELVVTADGSSSAEGVHEEILMALGRTGAVV